MPALYPPPFKACWQPSKEQSGALAPKANLTREIEGKTREQSAKKRRK